MDHREFPILYVDDEPDNLRIFELTFRRDFTILTAASAEEGLVILNENPIAVVLSDHRMPGMSGVDFLSRVRAFDPKTIRMLVTAYGDVETLHTAINDGSIYRYIPKPWNPDDLRLTLQRGIETFALDRERETLIQELTQLNQLSRDLHRELDLSRVIALLLRAAQGDMGFDGAALLFFDEQRSLRNGDVDPRAHHLVELLDRTRELALQGAAVVELGDELGHPQLPLVEELETDTAALGQSL